MVASGTSRWLRAALAISLVLAIGWGVATARAAPDGYPTGDGALIELNTLYATRGQAWLGPYSQFGWNHPGPLIFYALAPFYELGARRSAAINVGALAVNLLVLSTLVLAAQCLARPGLTLSLAGGLLLFALRVPALLDSPWNPHVIVLAAAALPLTAAAAAVRGRFLTATVLLATLLIQTHVATVAFVVAVVGAAVLWRATLGMRPPAGPVSRGGLPEPMTRRQIVTAVVVGVAAWVPPALEQWQAGAHGNIGMLVGYFARQADGGVALTRALEIWLYALGLPLDPRLAPPQGWALTPEANRAGELVAAVAVALLPLVWWRARQRGDQILGALAWMGLLGSAATYVAVSRIPVDVGDYHIFWLASLGLFNLAVVLDEPVAALLTALSRPATVARRARLAAVASLALVAGGALAGSFALRRTVARLELEVRHPPVRARVHGDVLAFLDEHGWKRPLVRTSSTSCVEAVAFVTRQVKDGRPVAVEPRLTGLVGDRLPPGGREDVVVIFSDNTAAGAAVHDPTATLVSDRRLDHRRLQVYARATGAAAAPAAVGTP